MSATSNQQHNATCPNCKAPLINHAETVLRAELRKASEELTRMRERFDVLQRSTTEGERQDADRRAKLSQEANTATARAKEAEKREAATAAELAALRRGLGNMMEMMTNDVERMRARDRLFERVRKCAACDFTGELVGDHAEYCAKCGENVTAQPVSP